MLGRRGVKALVGRTCAEVAAAVLSDKQNGCPGQAWPRFDSHLHLGCKYALLHQGWKGVHEMGAAACSEGRGRAAGARRRPNSAQTGRRVA